MTQIEALIVEPSGEHRIETIDNDWQGIKQVIDGWLEAVGGRLGEWTAYGDEEGNLKGLPPNPVAGLLIHQMGGAPVIPVGRVLFVGSKHIGGEDGYEDGDIPARLREMVENLG